MEYMSAKLAKQNVYCTGKQLGNWQAAFVATRGKIRNKRTVKLPFEAHYSFSSFA